MAPVLHCTLALALVGCSLTAIRPPGAAGKPGEAPPAECTSSYLLPVGDTVAVAGTGTVGALAANEDIAAGSIVMFGLAAVAAVSAGHGYAWVAECRALPDARVDANARRAASAP